MPYHVREIKRNDYNVILPCILDDVHLLLRSLEWLCGMTCCPGILVKYCYVVVQEWLICYR
ncbi:hypothetical protein HanXRQr2_Chr17g0785131 [Helianthus annuus]|uniref:Uncharacterized protein n=1 Tax=Helianthus annuus TaxID=4232 RepID=A0A9K3DH14_HELAN|nr:hypothetical protein HanXRQr2_Chr17g0785131 [Helianthus annuus]KAJ0811655.1 hypothetical protein HanPSC8_Chr17g0753151 [Helianthus annuus]